MADTKLTTKQAARILGIVQRVDASAPKVKTAFMSVMGTDLRSSGLSVDDVRAAMQAASDMGVEAGEEETQAAKPKRRSAPKAAPSLKALADNEAEQAEREIAAEDAKPAKGKVKVGKIAAATTTDPVTVTPAQAKKILAEKQAEDEKWEKVERITEFTEKGKPSRVDIRCVDPETEEPIKGAAGVRNIKVQDLFQVRYTVEGAKRARSMARRDRKQAAAAPAAPAQRTKAVRTRAKK